MANYDMILNVGHGENTFPDTGSKGIAVDGKRQKKYAEHTANVEVGKRVAKILDDHGVKYLLTQPFNGKDVPLSTRVNKANATNAKLYQSIHMNAGDKDAKGVCAFYHGYGSTGTANGKKTDAYVKYAKEEGLDLYHGGKWGSEKGKWNDFYETRMPKMYSVITENGFMTNKEDFERIFHNKDNYYDRVARVNAKFALDVLGIKYKGDAKPTASKEEPAKKSGVKVQDDLYRVRKSAGDNKTQIGAFTKLASAKSLADRTPGYKVFDQDGKHIYTPAQAAPKKAAAPKSSGSAIVPYPGHLIKEGSRGKDVERIQRAVNVNPDGIFGANTKKAVMDYQKRQGLSADGIVGLNTWNKMF